MRALLISTSYVEKRVNVHVCVCALVDSDAEHDDEHNGESGQTGERDDRPTGRTC